jgi:hypothetical protein
VSLRHIASATAVAAAVLGAVAATAPAAQAQTSMIKLVYAHYYTQPNALAQCQAAGDTGVNFSRWDFYRCVTVNATTVQLLGYLQTD